MFEWDENKNLSNIEKHGISFHTASQVFEDENRIEMYDYVNSTINEDRFRAIGLVDDVLFVVFTGNSYHISKKSNTKREEGILC